MSVFRFCYAQSAAKKVRWAGLSSNSLNTDHASSASNSNSSHANSSSALTVSTSTPSHDSSNALVTSANPGSPLSPSASARINTTLNARAEIALASAVTAAVGGLKCVCPDPHKVRTKLEAGTHTCVVKTPFLSVRDLELRCNNVQSRPCLFAPFV